MSVDFNEGMAGLQYDEIPFGDGSRGFEQEMESVARTAPLRVEAEPAAGPGPAGALPPLPPLPVMPGLGSNGSAEQTHGMESEDDLRARVAGNLAMGLARVLVSAIRDLESHSLHDKAQLAATVHDHQKKLDLALTGLGEIRQRVEVEVQAGLESLREANQEHRASLEGLKMETSDRIDALVGRLQLQQEELSSLPPRFAEMISPRVAAVVERLDKQAEAIRSICETGIQREVLLDELSEVLTRLKGSWNGGRKVPVEL